MTIGLNVKLIKSGTELKHLDKKIEACSKVGLLIAGNKLAESIRRRITSGGVTGPTKVRDPGGKLLFETGQLAGSFVAVMEGNSVMVGSLHTTGTLGIPLIEYHEFVGGRVPIRQAITPTMNETVNVIDYEFERHMNACLGGMSI